MAGKKKVATVDDFLKLYFSSLSARTACYLYFNVCKQPNTFVLSNADYVMLGSYIPKTLCIHVVEFKDTQFYNEFIRMLRLPTDRPYVMHVSKVLKVLNKKSKETQLAFLFDKEYHLIVSTTEDSRTVEEHTSDLIVDGCTLDNDEEEEEFNPWGDEEEGDEEEKEMECSVQETFTNDVIAGALMTDVRALLVLQEVLEDMARLDDIWMACPHYKEAIPGVDYLHSNVYTRPVDLTRLTQKDGNRCFTTSEPCQLLLIDGADTVSLKEFVKKRKGLPELIVWVDDNSALRHASRFEDEEVLITSTRPFAFTLPMGSTYHRQC